jgi:hypothetical protein
MVVQQLAVLRQKTQVVGLDQFHGLRIENGGDDR